MEVRITVARASLSAVGAGAGGDSTRVTAAVQHTNYKKNKRRTRSCLPPALV
jgi:hypothetical protein